MTSITTKSDSSQPATEAAVHLFDNWFDPIEAGLRGRVRDFIHAMIEGELDMALSRPRYARHATPPSGEAEGAAGAMTATVDITNPIFTDIEAARAHFEAIRWPQGAYCPYCGQTDTVKALGGKSMGPGWYHCKECRRKFTAAVGTIYERSHIPMTKWLLATHLMCARKKGMSAHQLHRMIGLPYKTAWFMAHRIREGMRELNPTGPLGGEGKTVEFDETYVGGKERNKHANKRNKRNIGGTGKEQVSRWSSAAGRSARITFPM